MIDIQTNIQLQSFNTLNLNAVASHYCIVRSLQDLREAIEFAEQAQLNMMILSGGSNMLLPEYLDALVVQLHLDDLVLLAEDDTNVTIRVGAGRHWHEFVLWTTEQGFYGLQNLALIPGWVGAAPVQNIGAYGVEVGEFIEFVEAFDRTKNEIVQIQASDCHFSYRHSIFKDQPERFVITAVIFKLLKQPQLKMNYGDLKAAMGDDITPYNLQQQVIKIRQSKLPDPAEYPNAGSFFKNPILIKTKFEEVLQLHPTIPHYPQADGSVKVAAGWLIDQSGWKGKKLGKVGMFDRQALVLVNYADASLTDVQATYRSVQQDVLNKFGILLEPEPVLFDQKGSIQSHLV